MDDKEELSYSLHLSNDKNKSKKARRSVKNIETGTTSLSNNAIQNHQQLSKVDKHNLRKYDEEQELSLITHLRAHETVLDLVCRLLLEKKKRKNKKITTKERDNTGKNNHGKKSDT